MKEINPIMKALWTKINYHFLPKEIKEEIKKRREQCITCPFNSKNAMERGIYTTKRKDLHCKFCGCNIQLFTLCLSCECSIKEYNQENNYNIPLRWKQILYKK